MSIFTSSKYSWVLALLRELLCSWGSHSGACLRGAGSVGCAPSCPLLPAQGLRLVAVGLGVSMKPGTGGQGGCWGFVGVSRLVLVGVALHLPASTERGEQGACLGERCLCPPGGR